MLHCKRGLYNKEEEFWDSIEMTHSNSIIRIQIVPWQWCAFQCHFYEKGGGRNLKDVERIHFQILRANDEMYTSCQT